MPMNMEQIKDLFDRFSKLMDENTKGVKIGCYSVALIGLTVALHRVRPFSKFKKPTDIPNLFIRNRRELLGTVERIEPSGALLMINHKPLVSLPFTQNTALPVKISGVNVTGLGISWLQTIVAGHEVKFIPILKENTYLHCEVFLEQQTHDNKLRTIDLGESLVAIGFATIKEIERPLLINFQHNKYYKRLKAAEINALKKKLGFKYYIKPSQESLSKAVMKLNNLIISKVTRRTYKVAVT